jgi:integrase
MDAIERKKRREQNFAVLMPHEHNKDVYSRLLFFLDWLDDQNLPWYRPTLSAYKNYLLHDRTRVDPRTGEWRRAPLSPASANAHLATIRGRYRALLNSTEVRDRLYDALPPDLQDPASRKAVVDELLIRIEHDIHPHLSRVKELTVQDTPDAEHLRLTPNQVRALIRTPGLDRLTTLRDTAILALLVCTGIREAELVALDVEDLRQTFGGELSLLVRSGKGKKQRLVPYGPLDWCLVYVERWLKAAQITSGAVFRGVFLGDKRVRKTRLTERAVNQIMHRYPVSINGVMTVVRPHDLRRTYARSAYLHGMDAERIRQNLGHAHLSTTQEYIGRLSGEQRRPPEMFRLPHSPKELAQLLSEGQPKRRKPKTSKRSKAR